MESKLGLVGVIGSAVAGSEAASILAKAGFPVVVFESKPLPYGKIEDGLPKWHIGLRNQNIKQIDEKISHPFVLYVPLIEVGKDIPINYLFENLSFDLVIIAFGAWQDRPLKIEGADKYINKRIFYQNDFVYWFNHYHEENYKGPFYPIEDNMLVIGGGLASIDVIKIIMIELTRKVLFQNFKINASIIELEKGIPAFLSRNNIKFDDLGIQRGRLTYRRQIHHMPLTPQNNPQQNEKVAKIQMEKYCFDICPNLLPKRVVEKNGEFEGIEFVKTTISANGDIVETSEKVVLKASYVVSSIGSIPRIYDGLPRRGETYAFDPKSYRVETSYPIYIIGNAATGKGNIQVSKKHAEFITSNYVLKELKERGYEPLNEIYRNKLLWSREVVQELKNQKFTKVLEFVYEHYKKISYTNYLDWKKKHYKEFVGEGSEGLSRT